MKVCCKCKVEKPLLDYNKDKKRPDGHQVICRICSNIRSAEHYLNNKSDYRDSKKKSTNVLRVYVLDYLKTHTCIDCPETNPVCLDFDHVYGIKSRNIAELIHAGVSLENLKLEMDKCVVRCANCHRKKTAKDFGWYKNIVIS